MPRPVVSVVIPTHNRFALLRAALDSVHNQAFREFETIVVDDGSTEDLRGMVSSHATRPQLIRLPEQAGPAAARNCGIRAANGEFIAFLDSDDLWLPTKLARFVAALRGDSKTKIYYGPMAPITADGRPMSGHSKPCVGGRITEALFLSSFVHVPTIVCCRDLLVHHGLFDESLPVCEDYDLWLRMSLDESFGLIDEPLALRRLHPDRLSKSCMRRNLAVKAKVLREFYESIAGQNVISKSVAYERLGHVCHVAGRAAFYDRRYQEADALLTAARQYGHPGLRTLPLNVAAKAMSRFQPAESPATSKTTAKSPAVVKVKA